MILRSVAPRLTRGYPSGSGRAGERRGLVGREELLDDAVADEQRGEEAAAAAHEVGEEDRGVEVLGAEPRQRKDSGV